MLKANLISFFRKTSEVFVKNYVVASKTADTKAIHDMRVSIKRIDTCVRMLNFNKQTNFRLKKSVNPLMRLFRNAGPVRDFQVQMLIIDKLKVSIDIADSLIDIFIEKKIYLEQKFLDVCKSFNLLQVKRTFRLVEHYIEQLSEDEILMKIKEYEKNRVINLAQYSNPKKKAFNLHNARKTIKDLSYLTEILVQSQEENNGKYEMYRQTGHILGDWHDRAIMFNFLNTNSNHNPKNISASAELLKSSILEQKENLKQKYLEDYWAWSIDKKY